MQIVIFVILGEKLMRSFGMIICLQLKMSFTVPDEFYEVSQEFMEKQIGDGILKLRMI
ncbi:MAG: hypothetical protein V8R91_10350 [Butyricimonas faecihominis]